MKSCHHGRVDTKKVSQIEREKDLNRGISKSSEEVDSKSKPIKQDPFPPHEEGDTATATARATATAAMGLEGMTTASARATATAAMELEGMTTASVSQQPQQQEQ